MERMKAPMKSKSFLRELFGGLLHGFGMLLAAFAIGTGASAIACVYYGAPLILSLVGGLVVLGIALWCMSESSFF